MKLGFAVVATFIILHMIPSPTMLQPNNRAVPIVEKANTVPATIVEQKPVVEPLLSPKQQLMADAGIPKEAWEAVDYIVSHESSWQETKWNSQGSGAYGLCQSLPAHKMASAGGDYMTNPVTQLKWCHSYALERYGSWHAGKAFWLARVPIRGKDVGNWW